MFSKHCNGGKTGIMIMMNAIEEADEEICQLFLLVNFLITRNLIFDN